MLLSFSFWYAYVIILTHSKILIKFKMDSKVCKDSFSEYVGRNKTKGMSVTLDATYSWRNMVAYFLHFRPVKISSYKNYFCCIVSPFLVIWFLMLRIAHFNFLHNLYTFPIQPLNSLYFLPTDLLYDFVSISIATFVLLVVAFVPVVYYIFVTGARFVAEQIVSCESILEA